VVSFRVCRSILSVIIDPLLLDVGANRFASNPFTWDVVRIKGFDDILESVTIPNPVDIVNTWEEHFGILRCQLVVSVK
jgi:hypothetical protein